MKRFFGKIVAVVTVLVILCTTFIVPVSATEPTNLVPSDIFSSKEKASEWFTISDKTSVSVSDGVMNIPIDVTTNTAWVYTNQAFPTGSYTIKLDVQPVKYLNGEWEAMGGIGILLGTGSGGAFPWYNVRFDPNMDFESIGYYAWYHDGGAGADSLASDIDFCYPDFTGDMWMTVVIEVTPDVIDVYLEGEHIPDVSDVKANMQEKFPKGSDLTYIGFFPEGKTQGFNVRNFGIYNGVDLGFLDAEEENTDPTDEPVEDPTDEPVEDPTDEPTDELVDDATDAPVDDATDAPADDAGEDDGGFPWWIILIIALVVAAGVIIAVILINKRKKGNA